MYRLCKVALRRVVTSCCSVCSMAGVIKPLFSFSTHVPMGWDAVLLLTSILSATDPVAVTALLSSMGAPAKLSMLIEGESLLNDGGCD